MEKLIKIQSMSDIITNSSSEVFIIETDKTWQEVQEEIKSWNLKKDEGGSGMGQYCEVFDNKRHYPNEAFDFGEPMFPWLGKNHLAIDIDCSRKKTIDRIFKEFNVRDCDEADIIVHASNRRAVKIYRNEDDLADGQTVYEACVNCIEDLKEKYYNDEKERLFKEMSEIVDFETAKKIGKMYEEYQYAVIALDEIESERKDREEYKKIDNEEQEKES